MLGDEGDQQEEDCYHGDEDASRDPRSVETRSYAKRRDSTHITPFTDRRGYAQWPSSLVWTCPETRCNQRHPQSDGAGNTRYQTTRAPQEDMAPTDFISNKFNDLIFNMEYDILLNIRIIVVCYYFMCPTCLNCPDRVTGGAKTSPSKCKWGSGTWYPLDVAAGDETEHIIAQASVTTLSFAFK